MEKDEISQKSGEIVCLPNSKEQFNNPTEDLVYANAMQNIFRKVRRDVSDWLSDVFFIQNKDLFLSLQTKHLLFNVGGNNNNNWTNLTSLSAFSNTLTHFLLENVKNEYDNNILDGKVVRTYGQIDNNLIKRIELMDIEKILNNIFDVVEKVAISIIELLDQHISIDTLVSYENASLAKSKEIDSKYVDIYERMIEIMPNVLVFIEDALKVRCKKKMLKGSVYQQPLVLN